MRDKAPVDLNEGQDFYGFPERGRRAEWQLCHPHDCVSLHQDLKSISSAQFPEISEILDDIDPFLNKINFKSTILENLFGRSVHNKKHPYKLIHRSTHILINISEVLNFFFPLALIYTKMASEHVTDGKKSFVVKLEIVLLS